MTEGGFQRLKADVLQVLGSGLDPRLTYHSAEHTADVIAQAERIITEENLTDSRTSLLVRIAALFHDTGFLYTYKGHEKKSCEIMLDMINPAEFEPCEIDLLKSMIMSTRIPQSPANRAEMILCDADLDYLGRDDFEIISDKLREEFMAYDIVDTFEDWNNLQVDFFESHKYFTGTSQRHRQPVKMKHLELLRQKI